jgi:signal transduction histidine kinase
VCKLEIARARGKAGEPEELLSRLDSVSLHLNRGIALKRRIIEDLRPSSLTHLGLNVGVENLCQDMRSALGVPVNLSMAPLVLSPDAELSVYRFIQEALTNVGKYARASRVEVSLVARDGRVTVAVTDDGVGFNANIPRAGFHGLAGMQFRAESLGGAMQIRTAPGQGTTVQMEFPELLEGLDGAERDGVPTANLAH